MGKLSTNYVLRPPDFPFTFKRNYKRLAEVPHNLVIIKKNAYYNHNKVYPKNRNILLRSYARNSRTILEIQKGLYLSPLVYFHLTRSIANPSPNYFYPMPSFPPLINYVTTRKETWLANMIYVSLM